MKSGFTGENFSYKTYSTQSDILAALQLMPEEIRWMTTVAAQPEQFDLAFPRLQYAQDAAPYIVAHNLNPPAVRAALAAVI